MRVFLVIKYIDKYICFFRNIVGSRVFFKVISKFFLENFGNLVLNMKLELILSIMKKRYGFDLKYWKIWKVREEVRKEVRRSF